MLFVPKAVKKKVIIIKKKKYPAEIPGKNAAVILTDYYKRTDYVDMLVREREVSPYNKRAACTRRRARNARYQRADYPGKEFTARF